MNIIREMNEMDKAKTIILDKNLSDYDIELATGISRQNIYNYRKGTTSLEKAKWTVVHELSDLYDDMMKKSILNDSEESQVFLKFVNRLGGWFSEEVKDQIDIAKDDEGYSDDMAIAKVVERLNERTTKDVLLLIDLFRVYIDNN